MKKILILAYDFPPYVSVGGLRPYNWFKYLHRFGIFPIVVTRQWNNKYGNHLDYIAPSDSEQVVIEESENGIIIKTPYIPNAANRLMLKYGESKFKLLRKLISAFYEFGQFVFSIGSKSNLYREADKYLANNKVDAIIATGDPFILFKYAAKLSKKHNIHWIADYRDPWLQDKSLQKSFYRGWFAFFERRFLKTVNLITTVQSFFVKQIEQNIKNKKFEILYNGFDPKIIEVSKGIKQNSNTLSIGFIGTIKDNDPIEQFLKTCNELAVENFDFKIKLNFYGINREDIINQLISNKYQSINQNISIYPHMENIELAKLLSTENVFLLFNYYSIVGTKIYDYLALKRKIILCFEDGKELNRIKAASHFDEIDNESKRPQAEILVATNSGIIVKDSNHLKDTLLELNAELHKNGFIKCESVNVEQYSRVRQVEKLAKIIKEICLENAN